MPEQLAWYLMLAFAAVGVAAGMRRNALVTSVFVAYAVTALMVVAFNSGNVGTLVRHRSFALPFLIALGAVGVTAAIGRWCRRIALRSCEGSMPVIDERGRLFGTINLIDLGVLLFVAVSCRWGMAPTSCSTRRRRD